MTQLGTGFGSLRVTPEHSFRPWSAPPHSELSGHRQKEGGAVVTLPLAVLGASTVSRLGLQSASQPRLSYAEMAEDYPRYPDIHDLDLTLLNPRMIVDVTPYMNPSPFTVSPNTHVSQVFNLFRTMGLRHLPVVNAVGEIVGIITRHNLTYEFLQARLRQHYQTL